MARIKLDPNLLKTVNKVFTARSRINLAREESRKGKAPEYHKYVIIDDADFLGVEQNLLNFEGILTNKCILMAAQIVIHILAEALPRTPVDTGLLRESGLAFLEINGRFYPVGEGQKNGIVRAKFNIPRAPKRSSYVEASVSFMRFNERGEDIAIWTHEDLNYWNSEIHPRARTAYTGPKYLETAFLENIDKINKYVLDQVSYGFLAKEIKVATKRLTKKGAVSGRQFVVNQVRIIENRIKRNLRTKI